MTNTQRMTVDLPIIYWQAIVRNLSQYAPHGQVYMLIDEIQRQGHEVEAKKLREAADAQAAPLREALADAQRQMEALRVQLDIARETLDAERHKRRVTIAEQREAKKKQKTEPEPEPEATA